MLREKYSDMMLVKAREKKKGNQESEINVCKGIKESRRLKPNIVRNIQVEPYFF